MVVAPINCKLDGAAFVISAYGPKVTGGQEGPGEEVVVAILQGQSRGVARQYVLPAY